MVPNLPGGTERKTVLREKDRETNGDSQKGQADTETEGTASRPQTHVGTEGRIMVLPNSPPGLLRGG